MEYRTHGKILKGVGGLYTIKLIDEKSHSEIFGTASPLASQLITCSVSGSFRHNHIKPLVGDNVEIVYTDHSLAENDAKSKVAIVKISLFIVVYLFFKSSMACHSSSSCCCESKSSNAVAAWFISPRRTCDLTRA